MYQDLTEMYHRMRKSAVNVIFHSLMQLWWTKLTLNCIYLTGTNIILWGKRENGPKIKVELENVDRACVLQHSTVYRCICLLISPLAFIKFGVGMAINNHSKVWIY